MIYTPRDYQRDISGFIKDNERGLVLAGMGTGKTPSTLDALADLLLFGEVRHVLILAPKRVALSTWPGELRKFSNLSHLHMAVAVGPAEVRAAALAQRAQITVCTYDLIPWLIEAVGDDWFFDMIVADECFPAGTLVAAESGDVPIEVVSVGDKVWTRSGLKKVTHVFKKRAESLVEVRLVNGTRLVCTPSHRVWTQAGWKAAQELRRTDSLYSAVPALRPDIHDAPKQGEGDRQRSVLQSELLDEGLDECKAEGVLCRGSQPGLGSVAEREPLLERRRSDARIESSETERSAARERPPSCRSAGWEWSRHEPLRSNVVYRAEARMDLESSDLDQGVVRTRASDKLQAGLCLAGGAGLLGGGRGDAQHDCRPRAGRQEAVGLRAVGVDCVAYLEQPSPVDVWDLEVEEDHEFFANGFLVHNCSKLKGLRVSLQRSKNGKLFLQGQGSKRAKALAKYALGKTKRFIGLTGTPAPNGIEDVWALAFFVDMGQRLGSSFTAYVDRFFQRVPGGDGYTQIRPLKHAQAEVQNLIRDITITIEAKDYFDLPPLIENTILVELPSPARKQYREMEKQMFTEIAGQDIEVFNAAAKTNKCLQLSSGAAYLDDQGNWAEVHDEKLQALESVIEEANGMPVLVAYQFKSDLARILKRFKQARALSQDPKMIDEWNAGRVPVLVVHPASAGHGLSLQHGSNILVFFSTGWNLENDQQVIERIGPTRQAQSGYNRPVFLHRIVARDTLEEVVVERIKTKASVQDALLQALKRRRDGARELP